MSLTRRVARIQEVFYSNPSLGTRGATRETQMDHLPGDARRPWRRGRASEKERKRREREKSPFDSFSSRGRRNFCSRHCLRLILVVVVATKRRESSKEYKSKGENTSQTGRHGANERRWRARAAKRMAAGREIKETIGFTAGLRDPKLRHVEITVPAFPVPYLIAFLAISSSDLFRASSRAHSFTFVATVLRARCSTTTAPPPPPL